MEILGRLDSGSSRRRAAPALRLLELGTANRSTVGRAPLPARASFIGCAASSTKAELAYREASRDAAGSLSAGPSLLRLAQGRAGWPPEPSVVFGGGAEPALVFALLPAASRSCWPPASGVRRCRLGEL